MDRELRKIRDGLAERSRKEAHKLWRFAWRALRHGCSPETVKMIREEADWCYHTGTAYPERIISGDAGRSFQYAFRC